MCIRDSNYLTTPTSFYTQHGYNALQTIYSAHNWLASCGSNLRTLSNLPIANNMLLNPGATPRGYAERSNVCLMLFSYVFPFVVSARLHKTMYLCFMKIHIFITNAHYKNAIFNITT